MKKIWNMYVDWFYKSPWMDHILVLTLFFTLGMLIGILTQ